MTDYLLLQLADYGVALLFIVTFSSCLAAPVPASLLMLTAGAFVASGDLSATTVMASALAGAVLGDQAGYTLGKYGRSGLFAYLDNRPKRARLLERAEIMATRYGGWGVFFSRWLVAPLGPYVNFAAGIAGHSRIKFFLWGIAGETVWVTLYISLGYGFSANIGAVAEYAADISGLLAGLTLMMASGIWLLRALRPVGRSIKKL